jgi:hypothetical protein
MIWPNCACVRPEWSGSGQAEHCLRRGPVRRNRLLRSSERDLVRTNCLVERVFDLVLRVRGGAWFRPQVARVVRGAAQLQGDEVIFLVVAAARVGVAVGGDLLPLELVRVGGGRPDGLGSPRLTHRRRQGRLRRVRIDRARCAGRIWQGLPTGAAHPACSRPGDRGVWIISCQRGRGSRRAAGRAGVTGCDRLARHGYC